MAMTMMDVLVVRMRMSEISVGVKMRMRTLATPFKIMPVLVMGVVRVYV